MRYIGSKASALNWIDETIRREAPDASSLCDPFAGTCVVARHFKQAGMRVVTGDALHLSHALQSAMLGCDAPPGFEGLAGSGVLVGPSSPAQSALDVLDGLEPIHGYMRETFSEAGAERRLFFTPDNAGRIDAARTRIDEWRNSGLIDAAETSFLLAALLEGADRVANTAGTYYAHLKSLVPRARRRMRLTMPWTTREGTSGGCHRIAAEELVKDVETDVLYLDPPYNERDYLGYYHVPETIARWDAPAASGRSGAPRRSDAKSAFCRRSQAGSALAQICRDARARHIFVHYTGSGMIPHDTIIDSLSARGRVGFEDRAVRAYSSRSGAAASKTVHRLYWCAVDARSR